MCAGLENWVQDAVRIRCVNLGIQVASVEREG